MAVTKGLKLIGKGAFTKCFLNTCGSTVTLITHDPIKECMAFGWFPNSALFPQIERVDYDEVTDRNVYEMKYYPKTRGLKNHLDPDQWEIYKTLRSVSLDMKVSRNIYDSYSMCYDAFCGIPDQDLKETMIEALDACNNYGSDVGFEISPRNVAVDSGKLVLLDCFYLKSKLLQVRGGRL